MIGKKRRYQKRSIDAERWRLSAPATTMSTTRNATSDHPNRAALTDPLGTRAIIATHRSAPGSH
jgi:hypothetical protein